MAKVYVKHARCLGAVHDYIRRTGYGPGDWKAAFLKAAWERSGDVFYLDTSYLDRKARLRVDGFADALNTVVSLTPGALKPYLPGQVMPDSKEVA